jgi:basic membrane protein A
MLTSMLKRVDNAVYDVLAAASAGKKVNDALGGGAFGRTYGLKLGGVGVSYSGGYINKYKSKIDAAAKAITAGKIKVPTTPAK